MNELQEPIQRPARTGLSARRKLQILITINQAFVTQAVTEALDMLPALFAVPIERAIKVKYGLTRENVWELAVHKLEQSSDEDIEEFVAWQKYFYEALQGDEGPTKPRPEQG